MSQTILEFKTQLEREFKDHPHYLITNRVLDCLLYIENNLDTIAATINDPKASSTLRDNNGMAFHIFAKTPDEVKITFTALIQQVEYCIRYLVSLGEPLFIAAFISNIRDSDLGCMEARLRQALNFCVFLESNCGRLDLRSLFQQFFASADVHQNSSSDLITCQNAFEFFESYVTYKTPVVIDRTLQPLRWKHVKNYLGDTLSIDVTAWNRIKSIDKLIPIKDKDTYKLYFLTEEEANSWLAFVRSVLPEQLQPDLEKARVIPERDNGYRFRLTGLQYTALLDEIKKPIKINEPLQGARLPLQGARLIKSLRWDADTFLTQFLIGCTRSVEQQHDIDLRKGSKKPWVVYPEGVFKRPNKPEREDDKTFSPYQSTSLVTDKVRPPVFGHGTTREKYLVGIVMPLEHAKLGSGMVYDGGTVGRPFDFDTQEEAEAYWRQKTDPNNPILFANLADLATELEKPKHKGHYNEVLAKLRWSMDGSCQVGIFSDTLEARLVAQWYAKKLRDHLRAQAKENGAFWNKDYQVPICIYLPEKQIYFEDYSPEAQQADIAAAMCIFNDPIEFNTKVAQKDYEFLLAPLLRGEDVSDICSREIDSTPLLYRLLDAGKYQLVEALLEQDFNKTSRQIPWNPSYQKYLFKAAEKGHHHIIRWLCDIGADINATNPSNIPALFYAIKERHYFAQMACLEARGFDWMTRDSNGSNALMVAAECHPTVVAPILDFIMTHAERLAISKEDIRKFILQVPKSSYNALMLAARFQPTAIAPILNFIMTHAERLEISNEAIRNFILQENVFRCNALLLAVQFQPTAVAPILDFIMTYAERLEISNEGIQNFILQESVFRYNALMVAAQCHPTVVAPILDFIMTHAERLDIRKEDIRKFILQVNPDGDNALMLGARYHPTAVAPILDFILTDIKRLGISNEDIRKFILQGKKNDHNALLHAAKFKPTAVAPILDFIMIHAERLDISKEDIRNFILWEDIYGCNALMVAAQFQPTAMAPISDFITSHAASLGDDTIRKFILQVVDGRCYNFLMLKARVQPDAVAPLLNFLRTHADLLNNRQLSMVLNYDLNEIEILRCNILKEKLNTLLANPDIGNTLDGLPLIVRLAKASIGRDALHEIYIETVNTGCADNPAKARELLEHALQTNNALGCFFATHRGPGLFARGDTVSQAALRAALERLPIEPTSPVSIARI